VKVGGEFDLRDDVGGGRVWAGKHREQKRARENDLTQHHYFPLIAALEFKREGRCKASPAAGFG
jgi:hypothetical protein